MFKKLFTHSLLYTLAPQIPRIASLILMPVFTAHLKSSDYGIYGVISSYVLSLSALKDLGFAVVFFNTFYQFPSRWKSIWRILYGHLLIWSSFYFLLLLTILVVAMPGEVGANKWPIIILTIIPAVLFDNTNSIANYYYRASQKPAYIAIVSIVSAVCSIAITYYGIVVLKLGYMSWFIALFVSSLIMFLMYFYPLHFKVGIVPSVRLRKNFIRKYLRIALPMIPHNYSSYLLNSSDRMIMNFYSVPIQKIGLYNIGYQFGSYCEAVGEAIGMAVGPFYSNLYVSNKDKNLTDARDLTFFLTSMFLFGTFLVSLWMKEIFGLIVRNAELRTAYDLAILILMGYAYRPMYWCTGTHLSIYNKTNSLWKMSLVAGLLNVALNLIFVPFFGIYAAAINTFISLLYIGFSGFFFKSYKSLKRVDHHELYWLFSIIILTLGVYLLRDAHVNIKLLITLGVVLGSLVGFKKYYNRLSAIKV